MKNISIWKDTVNELSFSKLEEDKNVDVLIIGGGITGASVYYHLLKSKLKIMLVEQNKIAMGKTCNSTGKLSFMQNDLINKIRENQGDDVASKYLSSQDYAIKLVKKIIDKENIDCDLEMVNSIIYTNKNDEITKLKSFQKFLEKNKIVVNTINSNKFVKSKYLISVNHTYMFHPIKFVYGLLENQKDIYEDTSIIKIEDGGNFYLSYTKSNVIKSKYIVVASHYPFFNLPFVFPLKGYLEKSYLSASKKNTNKLSLISYSNPFISIRTYQDYLIYLSNSLAINKKSDDQKNFNELKKKLSDLKLIPEYLWSNSDIMTCDSMPYIGEIKNNMYIGTGYNTWGMASSVLAGKIISDLILKKDNQFSDLFEPKRINLDMIIGGVSNLYKNASGFIGSYLKKQDKILEKNKYYLYDGIKVKKKCPHLGCKLSFNSVEETYDCPCHGSRFDKDGKCLSGPSNKDITINNKESN